MTAMMTAAAKLRRSLALALMGLTLSLPGAAFAASPSAWVKAFWPTAKAAGISRGVYDAALGNFTPDPDVLKKAGNQAEFVAPVWDYIERRVSETKIADGQAMLAQYSKGLGRIEERYGVDRYTLVAIWGIESHYGHVLDNKAIVKGTIRSLATLAYAGGSRAKFGRQQLIAALKILQRGDVSTKNMIGSWAGAMGHTQFIPTTYNAYAVDFDGDGRRDIWNTEVDALASAANYLKKSGWQGGKTWGYEVALAPGAGGKLLSDKKERSLGEWQKLGIRRATGKPFPRPEDKATLYVPTGTKGPAFLVVRNFRVIKRYNNANTYALAVGYLADRLRGGPPFEKAWPRSEPPLDDTQRQKIQALLTTKGLYDGEIDGNIGSGTRAAIMAFQESVGERADGIESRRLLQLLETGK